MYRCKCTNFIYNYWWGIIKISNENKFDSIILPSGLQPRAALGVSASILALENSNYK